MIATTSDRAKSSIPQQSDSQQDSNDRVFIDDLTDKGEINRRMIERERFLKKIGKRYHNATLKTFQAIDPQQNKALANVQAWVDEIHSNIETGRGLFLFGPTGTGKDHLAIAAMRMAIAWGYSVEWCNGLDFLGDLRDAMDTKTSEAELIRQLAKPDVLTISDPMPVKGGDELSTYQMSQLWRLIDKRYRDQLPTFVTCNVATRADAEKRMGVATVDRLVGCGVPIHCQWKSYRNSSGK